MSIGRRTFWRSYWIALRRSREDKRARAIALKISFALIYVLGYVLLIFLPLREREGVWLIAFYGFIYGSGAIAFSLLRRSHRRQDELLSYSLTGTDRLKSQKPDEVSPKVRNYIEDRALIIGSLVARAGSEIYIQHNERSPGLEVVTRQIQNSLLRQNGLWEKLEPSEADLVSAADGRWTVEQQSNVTSWCEQLRLLRWTLGIDAELMPLAHFPKVDFSLSRDLLGPERVPLESRPIMRSWDVRVERDLASEYTARVLAEFKGRALITSDPELEDWSDQLRRKSLGASTDYLAGSKIIGDLDDGSLRLLGEIAVTREGYAAYLVEQLSADSPSSFATWSERG